MQKMVDEFLRKTGMHYDSIELDRCCAEFVEEMKNGLAGTPSSLLMLPTYIRAQSQVPLEEEIIVMDAGGTNFRVATVIFDSDGKPQVENYEKHPMPGTKGRLSREQFFDTIVEYLMPVIDKSEKIGFCFSYPTEILPTRDGRLIHFNKEVCVDGVDGTLIGEGINEALAKKGKGPKTFILLNDTVATMLGGIAVTQDCAYDSYIGYILGTGTNTCYVEQSRGITKAPEAVAMGGDMAVNMESGGYARVIQGEVDRELDAATVNPGNQMLEKMVSGAYQGNVIFRTVKKAMAAGLFSPEFCGRMENLDDFTMYDIDQFCFFPYGGNALAKVTDGDEADTLTLFEIIDASFERAARLTAVNFAAILVHTGTGKNPTRPVCVAAEGTTFYKSKLFKGKLDYYVRSYLNDTLGVYCEFVRAENATLIGTAVAGLLN